MRATCSRIAAGLLAVMIQGCAGPSAVSGLDTRLGRAEVVRVDDGLSVVVPGSPALPLPGFAEARLSGTWPVGRDLAIMVDGASECGRSYALVLVPDGGQASLHALPGCGRVYGFRGDGLSVEAVPEGGRGFWRLSRAGLQGPLERPAPPRASRGRASPSAAVQAQPATGTAALPSKAPDEAAPVPEAPPVSAEAGGDVIPRAVTGAQGARPAVVELH